MLYSLAHLEPEKLATIQRLENEIGSPLLAMEEVEADTATLPAENVKKLRDAEEELGVILVAVKPN